MKYSKLRKKHEIAALKIKIDLQAFKADEAIDPLNKALEEAKLEYLKASLEILESESRRKNLDLLKEARKSLKGLLHLCEQVSRSGHHVRGMQAYKNAEATAALIRQCCEDAERKPRDVCNSATPEYVIVPINRNGSCPWDKKLDPGKMDVIREILANFARDVREGRVSLT